MNNDAHTATAPTTCRANEIGGYHEDGCNHMTGAVTSTPADRRQADRLTANPDLADMGVDALDDVIATAAFDVEFYNRARRVGPLSADERTAARNADARLIAAHILHRDLTN